MPKPISEQFVDLADKIDNVWDEGGIVKPWLSIRDREMIVDALRAVSTLRKLKEMHEEHMESIARSAERHTPAVME